MTLCHDTAVMKHSGELKKNVLKLSNIVAENILSSNVGHIPANAERNLHIKSVKAT